MQYGSGSTRANPGETNKELWEHLDDVCSYLSMGSHWHRRTANECRKLAGRGFGRWHEEEGLGDYTSLSELCKILMDKLDYAPAIDVSMLDAAEKFAMNSLNDFKAHFGLWQDSESKLVVCLNHAIHESRAVDIELYEYVCCVAREVQNERMRARMGYDRLELGGWNGHDIGVVNMVLHEYFEKHHKQGEMIDFNLG